MVPAQVRLSELRGRRARHPDRDRAEWVSLVWEHFCQHYFFSILFS